MVPGSPADPVLPELHVLQLSHWHQVHQEDQEDLDLPYLLALQEVQLVTLFLEDPGHPDGLGDLQDQ